MSTRLDRLLLLLANGANATVRGTAAQQLGSLAAQRVQHGTGRGEWRGIDGEWTEVAILLAKVLPYLRHKSWDARIAAAQAVEAICKAVGVWDPTTIRLDGEYGTHNTEVLTLPLCNFVLKDVLSQGEILVAAASTENKASESGANGVKTEGDGDAASAETAAGKLSAKERLALKRKRKTEEKQAGRPAKVRAIDSRQASPSPVEDSATPSEPVVIAHKPQTGGQVMPAAAEDETSPWEVKAGQWPFEKAADILIVDLLHSEWEIRHGAALGLRELLRHQSIGAGGMIDSQRTQWIERTACALLSVLARDRFVDFVGDHVSAPVREAAAQSLAFLSRHAASATVQRIGAGLLQLVQQNDVASYAWQLRHSGFLGIQYIVAIRTDVISAAADLDPFSVDTVLAVALHGLDDADDDIRAASASALLPLVGKVADLPKERKVALLDAIWKCLQDLGDDLTSSVAIVMDLLSQLLDIASFLDILLSDTQHPLAERVPCLFPFFRFTIATVRLAVVRLVIVFLQKGTEQRTWLDIPLLRLLYQNLLVEERLEIREQSATTWKAAIACLTAERLVQLVSPVLVGWFQLASIPIGSPIDPNLLFTVKGAAAAHNVDKPVLTQDLTIVTLEHIIAGRMAAISALSNVLYRWPSSVQEITFKPLLQTSLGAPTMQQRFVAAGCIEHWAEQLGTSLHNEPLVQQMTINVIAALESAAPTTYAETMISFETLYNDSKDLLAALNSPAGVALPTKETFQAGQARTLCGMQIATSASSKEVAIADEWRTRVLADLASFEAAKERADVQLYASIARACVALRAMPSKLSPLIRSLMNSIKLETNLELQQLSAVSLAHFIQQCCDKASDGSANPSDKVVQNLCGLLCQDDDALYNARGVLEQTDGILTYEQSLADATSAQDTDKAQPKGRIDTGVGSRGAALALRALADQFGDGLFSRLPKLEEVMLDPLTSLFGISLEAGDDALRRDTAGVRRLIDASLVIGTITHALTPSARQTLLTALPCLSRAARSTFPSLRYAAACCYGAICDADPALYLLHVVLDVLPFASDSTSVTTRRGVVEVIAQLVSRLDIRILPYLIFFVVPILGRMTDADQPTRHLATKTFALLIKLVPLEAGLPDPEGFPAELIERREHERSFLSQLMDGQRVEEYILPMKVNAELRKYQVEGVSWLAFLAKYQLHGILCDDMGLGKTLQSICILASKHHERAERFKASKAPDAAHTPSLVICPPTLTGHWRHEILTYVGGLRPMLYVGDKAARSQLRSQFGSFDVVITGYDTVRNDVEALSQQEWLYCILDEGHIIKNAKSKLTQAVKSLRSHHRLILSGTPIQNNVLELWSLFDFLMPGFLGTEKAFNQQFSKPILASRGAKSSSKAQTSGALALEALHKQVLPFLLRRLKEDVLDDLPPKIIQDYYCDLSPLQRELYEQFSNGEGQTVKSEVADGDSKRAGQHVFQSLQYLRQLVNHPRLVLKAESPHHQRLLKQLDADKSGEMSQSPKMQALKQILLDCGIGTDGKADTDEVASAPHRVLVFCQMRQMLDLIETELFRNNMPTVSYMRLDGSTPAVDRHGVVQTFNADPSIDVLLLTTHVGGLGLNLTSADTVVFVEHDWNPMKDLQAMDRAHRLGQKRVVNVYRLITRDTLEEKIMGLQKFKLNIASSVVTQQNASLSTMGTDQVLDLFSLSSAEEDKTTSDDKPMTQKQVLASLGELADQDNDDLGAAFFAA